MYAEIEWPLEIELRGDHQFAPKTMDYPGHDFIEDEEVTAARIAGVPLEHADAKALYAIVDKYPALTLKVTEADWQEDG